MKYSAEALSYFWDTVKHQANSAQRTRELRTMIEECDRDGFETMFERGLENFHETVNTKYPNTYAEEITKKKSEKPSTSYSILGCLLYTSDAADE